MMGGVDQRVLAMVGAGASKGTECFAFAHNVGSPVVPHRDLNTVIGHGIVGKDIPIMARLAEARRWSKR